MLSKQNRPGLGTALLMTLPLFVGCGPAPGQGLSLDPENQQSSAIDTADQRLAQMISERMDRIKSGEHTELAQHAYSAYRSCLERYSGDPQQLYKAATKLRDYILSHRDSSVFKEDSHLFDDATLAVIKSGPAIDITFYHQSLGDRGMGLREWSTSNSNIAHLAEFKMACAALVYDCTLP